MICVKTPRASRPRACTTPHRINSMLSHSKTLGIIMITRSKIDRWPLASVRQAWQNAFFTAQVEWLEYIEAPEFVVIEGATITSKSEQIGRLQWSKQTFARATDFQYSQVIHRIDERPGWATLVGSFDSRRNGRVLSCCDFSEFWIVRDRRWHIASLYLRNKLPGCDIAG